MALPKYEGKKFMDLWRWHYQNREKKVTIDLWQWICSNGIVEIEEKKMWQLICGNGIAKIAGKKICGNGFVAMALLK